MNENTTKNIYIYVCMYVCMFKQNKTKKKLIRKKSMVVREWGNSLMWIDLIKNMHKIYYRKLDIYSK